MGGEDFRGLRRKELLVTKRDRLKKMLALMHVVSKHLENKHEEIDMAQIVKELNTAIKAVARRQKTKRVNVSAPVLRSVFKAIAESVENLEIYGTFFTRYGAHLTEKKSAKSIADKKRYSRNQRKKKARK